MPDLSTISNEELFRIAGIQPPESSNAPDLSKYSDEELFKIAGIEPPPTQRPDRFALKSAKPYDSYNYGDALQDTGKTIINSLANLGEGVTQPILHPIQTTKEMAGAVIHPVRTIKGVGSFVKDRYGSQEKFANTVSTDPFGFGADAINAVLAGKGLVKGGTAIRSGVRAIQPSPEALINKAQKLTTEILQPSKGEMVSYLERGKTMPAIKEAAKVITKSKDYTQFRQKIDGTIKTIMDERNAILKQNDAPIGDYTKKLSDFINKAQKQGQYTPSEIQQMEDVYYREVGYMSKNPMTRVTGQSRKEALQDMTNKLLEKTEKGDVIDRDPARNLALDQLRRGLKEEVEAGDSRVADLNSRYGGLLKAKELIAGQEALNAKAIPEKIIQKISRFITHPQDIPGDVARAAAERQESLPAKTQKINKLIRKAALSKM